MFGGRFQTSAATNGFELRRTIDEAERVASMRSDTLNPRQEIGLARVKWPGQIQPSYYIVLPIFGCMNVVLFDLHTRGHHLPYAKRLKRAIETDPEHDVTFVTLCRTERCTELFESADIIYLDDPESPPIGERERSFSHTAERAVRDFFGSEFIEEYDVIHFLYADTILGPLWRNSADDDTPRLIAELNGTFFHRGTVLRRRYVHQAFLWLLQSSASGFIDSVVPERTSHEALWEDLYLYRCLKDDIFDSVIVHSEEARDYLSRLAPPTANATQTVPYPAPEDFGTDISRSQARKELDLPPDARILLFLGSMRTEKGIKFLLEALRRYQGREFTVVLAGPPVSVSKEEIERCGSESSATVISDLGFVDRPAVYYRAADAVILPYLAKYGRERASQMFQEVCSSRRPVIVPDFGVLGRLTEAYHLGVTYRQGSHESLTQTLSTFANHGVSFSKQQMQAYTDQHSDQRVADDLRRIYTEELAHEAVPSELTSNTES